MLVALVDYPTPLLTAAVEARVGGRVFATVADGAGAFELRVTPVDDAKPIVLLAKGNGTQSHIQYATILESMPTLMGQAGADGRLVYQENPYVKPSPFTTGLVVAIQAAQPALFAGNSPLAMPDRRVWSGRDQFRRTALLTALARGDVGLPAGAATVSMPCRTRASPRAHGTPRSRCATSPAQARGARSWRTCPAIPRWCRCSRHPPARSSCTSSNRLCSGRSEFGWIPAAVRAAAGSTLRATPSGFNGYCRVCSTGWNDRIKRRS